ncbi:MAG: LysE family translocator [Prevotella sp.]|jgi:threonine/homoserine/homoserine lactone efflux protein
MPLPFHIDFLEMILKGFLIGVIASAPMGPVGVLCIQRTLRKGRWYGFVTGVGAALSDIIYAMLTGLGMSFVMDLITNPTNKFWLQISGSVVLLLFGVYCLRSDPTVQIHNSGNKKGSLMHNGITAFLLTFSNPLIIFLFMGTFAQLAFVIPNHPFEMTLGYLAIITGALTWWFGLTWVVDKVRAKFDDNGLRIINHIIGGAVIIVSLIILLGTVFNLYTFHY